MKVVMLVGRSTGGIGTHAADLAAELRELGDDVAFVTDPLTARTFGIPDARTWWPARGAGLRSSVRGLRRLRRLVTGADVLHAHGHQAGVLAVLAAVGTGTPVVVSQHNAVLAAGGPRGAVSRVAQRFVARRAALVTGASSDLVDEARRHGARAARLAPVPSPRVPGLLASEPADDAARRGLAARLLEEGHAVNDPGGHDTRDPSTSGEGGTAPPLVLTIARIAPQKDLATLVDAAAELVALTQHLHELAPVWVVLGSGDRELRDQLVRRARALDAPVHFVGGKDDPEQWLRAADVFVLTSRWEARALVVQEAMAAGVPVVATGTGGLRDLVGGVGALVPPGDAPAVADAVARYLRDPALRHTASVAGRERAGSWDDGQATARRWRDWYAGLLAMT